MNPRSNKRADKSRLDSWHARNSRPGPWLAAFAVFFRAVGAVKHLVYAPTRLLDKSQHPVMDRLDFFLAYDPATDRRLVADDDHPKIGARQTTQRVERSTQEFEFIPRLDIVASVLVDDTVTIKKDGAHALFFVWQVSYCLVFQQHRESLTSGMPY